MAFKLNPYVDEQNHHRCHTDEQRYMRELDARGMLLRIGNMVIDAEQLVLRTFQCNSSYCTRCVKKDGKTTFKGSCCTDLEVDVTEEEVRRLHELGKIAKRKLRLPPGDDLSPIIERLAKNAFTETTSKHETAFRHLSSGRCSLSWPAADGAVLCGINALCMALELPLNEYKPDPCFLFPLHYVEPVPGLYFITLLTSETYQYIGADAYVGKLHCLSKPQPGSPPAYQFLKGEINHCFSGGLYEALDEAAQPILKAHGLLPDGGKAAAAERPAKKGGAARKGASVR